MNKFLRIALLGIALLMASGTVSAQASSTFSRFGMSDCGQWLEKKNETRKAWLLGYLSGQNVLWAMRAEADKLPRDPLGKLNSASQAFVWIDNYCRKFPLKTVADGADLLFIELALQQ